MFDIITTLFESFVSFLETLIKFVNFLISNITTLFNVLNYIPPLMRAPLVMALSVVIVLGIKKAVFA